jgi:protein gp37
MQKSKIEWTDITYNPVSGCLRDCPYCYARSIVKRFGKETICWGVPEKPHIKQLPCQDGGSIYELSEPCKNPYPFGFTPTLHCYKLDEPQRWRKPRTVFVGSMCDLFGDWVPDGWIEAVFTACAAAPQHRYLFLTKNPKRYETLGGMYAPPDMWLGMTLTSGSEKTTTMTVPTSVKMFLSIEPLHGEFEISKGFTADWIIIGAETGRRKGKIVPKKKWIDDICTAADEAKIPVFMKDSLLPIVGEANMRRELPWK